MVDKVRFAFTQIDPELGALSTLPYLPLILTYQNQSLNVSGLLDTGSSVNVTHNISDRTYSRHSFLKLCKQSSCRCLITSGVHSDCCKTWVVKTKGLTPFLLRKYFSFFLSKS